MSNVQYLLLFAFIFALALGVTLLAFRFFRNETPEEANVSEEAEELRRRAEQNVHSAEETAARAKRLQELLEVQRRGHSSGGPRDS